jgi:hypothetical protein
MIALLWATAALASPFNPWGSLTAEGTTTTLGDNEGTSVEYDNRPAPRSSSPLNDSGRSSTRASRTEPSGPSLSS